MEDDWGATKTTLFKIKEAQFEESRKATDGVQLKEQLSNSHNLPTQPGGAGRPAPRKAPIPQVEVGAEAQPSVLNPQSTSHARLWA